MRETNGLVLKITDQFMVVMCDDGKYRNLPLPNRLPRVGERIAVPLPRSGRRVPRAWLSLAAACLIIALGLALWPQGQPSHSYVVAIDINPNIELYLDSGGQVSTADALNSDAESLLHDLALAKLPVGEAVEQVLVASMARNYIGKDKENVIRIAAAKLKGKTDVLDVAAIKTVVEKTLQAKQLTGVVSVEKVDKAVYDQAKEQHLTLNQWLMLHAEQARFIEPSPQHQPNPQPSVNLPSVKKEKLAEETEWRQPVSGPASSQDQKERTVPAPKPKAQGERPTKPSAEALLEDTEARRSAGDVEADDEARAADDTETVDEVEEFEAAEAVDTSKASDDHEAAAEADAADDDRTPDEADASDVFQAPDEADAADNDRTPDEADASDDDRTPDEADASDVFQAPDEADAAGDDRAPDEADASDDFQAPDEADAAGDDRAPDEADAAGDDRAPDEADAAGGDEPYSPGDSQRSR